MESPQKKTTISLGLFGVIGYSSPILSVALALNPKALKPSGASKGSGEDEDARLACVLRVGVSGLGLKVWILRLGFRARWSCLRCRFPTWAYSVR